MQQRVWSSRNKWLGNLIPVLCALPLIIAGAAWMIATKKITPPPILLCAAGLVVGWLAVNKFGLWGNAAMKQELARKLLAKLGLNASDCTFVGFATPSYIGTLDAHEDLGFLAVLDDQIEFHGEDHNVSLTKNSVREIRRRANIHTLLGLGGWVSIEAELSGKPVRLLVEPRHANTLLGNKKVAKALMVDLTRWKNENGPG